MRTVCPKRIYIYTHECGANAKPRVVGFTAMSDTLHALNDSENNNGARRVCIMRFSTCVYIPGIKLASRNLSSISNTFTTRPSYTPAKIMVKKDIAVRFSYAISLRKHTQPSFSALRLKITHGAEELTHFCARKNSLSLSPALRLLCTRRRQEVEVQQQQHFITAAILLPFPRSASHYVHDGYT